MSYETPYAGISVLDLSQGVAAPYCGMLLAQYGADVIKVEPTTGDWSRGLGTTYGEHSVLSMVYNVGKRSIALDLKQPKAVEVVLQLAARADVVLESFRPGVMARLGLDYNAVRQRNERIIYASVSGFGQQGPYRNRPCTDTVAQAFSGFMAINRGRDGVPHKVDTIIMDSATGAYSFGVVAAALAARAQCQTGVHLDLSLASCGAALQMAKYSEYALEGGTPRLLNAPAGTYQTADGWIALTLTKDEHFTKLCHGIGLPALADDPRYGSFALRADHNAELVQHIGERMLVHTTAKWCALLREHDVLCEKVMDHGDWLADSHVQSNAMAPALAVDTVGEVPMPLTPGRHAHRGATPGIGEHGRAILSDLGLDECAIAALMDAGVVQIPRS